MASIRFAGKIELAALPVAGQVLRALFDRTIALDDAGARDTDEPCPPSLSIP
jgi:hypothetical protein